MLRIVFLFLGALFGFILSRAGATTYDFYAQLFLFQNLQLMKVMGTAAVVGLVGVFIIRKLQVRSILGREPIALKGKPMRKGLIFGATLFGMGWGLAGACPGTALAMLGEGKIAPVFTITGMLLGTFLYGWLDSRKQNPSPQTLPPNTSPGKA